MIKINPTILLKGLWWEGYALDLHTVESKFEGFDLNEREKYNTTRTPLGELLYRYKYKHDLSVKDEIVAVAANYITSIWRLNPKINLVIPVPPYTEIAGFQPVHDLAVNIGQKIKVPVGTEVISKFKQLNDMPSVHNYEARTGILKGAFAVKTAETQGKNILVFDDLYRSGATMIAVTNALREQGKANKVYVLALTKTRVKT